MNVLEMLRRRWWLSLIWLVAVTLAAVGVAAIVPPTYQAKAQVVLLSPPKTPGISTPTNPFLSFSDSLNVTADVLTLAVADERSIDRIVSQGGTRTFTVTQDVSASEPILLVTATASSKAAATRCAQLVIDELQLQLQQRQTDAKVPSDSAVTLTTIIEPETATAVIKGAVKIGLAVFVIGLALALLVLYLLNRSAAPPPARRVKGSQPAAESAKPSYVRQ